MSTHHVMQTMGVRMPSTSLYSTTVNVQSTWITKPTKQQSPRTVDDFDEDEEETLIQPYAGQFMNTSIHRGFGVSLESSPSLVLNADYTPLSLLPLSLWHWHDTLRAVWNGKAVVVAEYPNILVRSVTTSFSLPSVIALKKYHRKPDGEIATMNRRNLYVRDGFQCQVSLCINILSCVAFKLLTESILRFVVLLEHIHRR